MKSKMKIYHYMAASALLFSVAACSSDDDTSVTPYGTNPNAVRIQPSVSGVTVTRTSPEADPGTAFAGGDAINVSRDGTTFYEYTFDGAAWSPTSGTSYLMWGTDETAIALQAYYPTTAGMTSFTLPQNQSGIDAGDNEPYEIAGADYMTYSGTVTKGDNNSATFVMQRRTARVRVTIDGFGDQYSAGSACDVKIRSPHTTVSVDYSGTEPAVTGGGSTLLVTPLDGTGMTTGSTATALVAPSTTAMPDENFMEVTVSGETAPLYVKGIPAHEAGYSYDYHLTVGKNGIVINSVLVNPWNDPTDVVNGGTAEEETDGPDASTHTIKTSEAGQIAAHQEWITEAIGGGNSLTINGIIDNSDIEAIADYLKENSEPVISLDLSDAEITSIAYPGFYDTYLEGVIDLRAKSLGEVKLPKRLTEIGEMAFSNCPAFTVANWEELTSLTTIGRSAFMGSGLKGDIILPESITTIGNLAFSETAITSIVFPSGITTIGHQMFYRCYSLTKVVFKGDVESFGEYVFGACSALKEIDLSACTTVPTYEKEPFYGWSSDKIAGITLKVKAELVDSFKGDENWGKCSVTAAEQ